MSDPKYCVDCKWSKPDLTCSWNLRCANPKVNSTDPWALSATEINGSSCREERESRFFGKCGMSGKLWEMKDEPSGRQG